MAIQTINLGTSPTGVGGDTVRSTAVKINENFSNLANAASRLVGTENNNVPVIGLYGIGETGWLGLAPPPIESISDMNQITKSGLYTIGLNSDKVLNLPQAGITGVMSVICRRWTSGASVVQEITTDSDCKTFKRIGSGGTTENPATWSSWFRVVLNGSNDIYTGTTAAGANVVIGSDGSLKRSTSSERYKNILSPLTLEDDKYNQAMSLEPIVYRSTAEADNPNYHYYSFSAEALGSFDKAFTLWRNTETVTETKTDSEGNEYEDAKEVDLEEPIAEGLNINALLAFNHAISIKQDKLIKALEKRIEDLEAINKGA